MAASKPSEYEKPPIGNAGDASQMSCSSAGVPAEKFVGTGAGIAAATEAISMVMLAIRSVHMTLCLMVVLRVLCLVPM